MTTLSSDKIKLSFIFLVRINLTGAYFCFLFLIRNMNLYYNEGSTRSTPTHYKNVSDEIVSNFTT